MKKRVISILLTLAMTLSLLPAALAEEATPAPEAEASTEETVSEFPFTDVASKAWYYNAVSYVYSHGIMNGTKKNHTLFSPEVPMSRAMLMTVLARYDGVDTSDGNTWFAKGQGWAVQNKISNGVLPEEPLTREQLVTMLWRYAGQPETAGSLEGFTDADRISRYAQTALQWAVEEGLLTGKKGGLLDPRGTATRAEVAAVLARFCQEYEAPEAKPEE